MSTIQYGAASAVLARMPSPKIWADCPVTLFEADPAKGFHQFDDFKNSVLADDGTAISKISGDMNWFSYNETAVAADVVLKAESAGILKLEFDGQDEDVHAISTGDNTAGIIDSPLKGERKRFWFEARFNVSTVADTRTGIFIGLVQPGEAKDGGGVFGGLANALAGVDYFGFAVVSGDGNDLTIVHNDTGTGSAQSKAGEITLTADTFVRIGFRLDVSEDKLRVYVDGVDLGDDVAIDITSVNFPSNTAMDVIVSFVEESGGTNNDHLELDWIRIAQEY